MTDAIQCATHGECQQTFVCVHLLGETAGWDSIGMNPMQTTRFLTPDVTIANLYNGWDGEAELVRISLLCSGFYERARIRNTRPSLTLDDLADLRWKCGSCEEWHTGTCLDFAYTSPCYWTAEHNKASRRAHPLPRWGKKRPETFLDDDYCAIDDRDLVRTRAHPSANHWRG